MRIRSFLAILALFCISQAVAQVKIGNNPQNIDGASVLELESTSQVLVITRMSTAQMNNITPLRGAMVYNTDEACIFYYDGTNWLNLCQQGAAEVQTFSADAQINAEPTIVITQTGDNYNFEVSEITGDNIADGSINGFLDIQFNSITDDQLAPNSVGQEELQDNTVGDLEIDYGQVTLGDFDNDPGFITSANIISNDNPNAITAGTDGGALYDDTVIQAQVDDNALDITQHLMDDGDLSDQNELITGATLDGGNNLVISQQGGDITVPLGSLNNAGTDNQNISTDNTPGNITIDNGNTITLNVNDNDASPLNEVINAIVFDPATNVLTINEGSNSESVNLGALAGAGADGVVSLVELNGTNLEFTGAGGGFNGSVPLGSLVGAGTDGLISNIDFDGTNLNFTGNDGAFNGAVNISSLAGGGADGVISNVAFDGFNLNFTGADGGFNGLINLSGLNTDNQTATDVPFTPYLSIGATQTQAAIEELKDEVDAIVIGGGGNPVDELQDIQIAGTVVSLTNPATAGNEIDLDPTFVTEAELAAFSIDDADPIPTNELQDLLFDDTTNILTITNPATAGNQVDLSTLAGAGTDDQNDSEVPLATPTDFDGDTVDETNVQGALNALLATSSDDQNADEVPVAATPANYTPATADVEAHLAAIDAVIGTGGTDDQNDSEVPLATPTDFDGDTVDETNVQGALNALLATSSDDQNADEVPVAATPANYTPATADVEAHLAAIDAVIGTGGTDDQNDSEVLLATPTDFDGDTVDETNVQEALNAIAGASSDDQNADEVPVAATPANYTPATADVEAHLAAIDAAIGTGSTDDQNDSEVLLATPTDFDGDTVDETNVQEALNAIAGASSDDQNADEVPVAATPANYTPATADVEAHLTAIDAAIGLSAPTLTDGNIFIGGAGDVPTDVTMTGDATIANTGVLTIENDAITTDKILPGGANQILRTNVAGDAVVWEDIPSTGGTTEFADQMTITGTGFPGDEFKVADDGITVTQLADNAVTTLKILDDNVTVEKIAAGTDGQVLTSNAGIVAWETPGAAGINTGTAFSIPIYNAAANDFIVATSPFGNGAGNRSLFWDQTKLSGSGALYIGLDGHDDTMASGVQSNVAKVQIAETVSGLAYPLQITNRDNGTGAAGILFSVEPFFPEGKGALVYQRSGGFGVGDFHFLQNQNSGSATNPALADAVMTIKNNGNVGIGTTNPEADEKLQVSGNLRVTGGIKDSAGNFGTNTQVLSSTGTGTAWVDAGGAGGTNLFEADAVLNNDVTHDLNTNNFVLGGLGNVGVGTFGSGPQNKFHVAGAGRFEGVLNSSGVSANEPSYRFTDDTNTGMYRIAEDQLGFSVGGQQAIRISEDSGNINTIVNGSFSTPIRTDSAAATVTILENDHTVVITNATGVDLPPATASNQGKIYILKNISPNILTLSASYVNSDGSNNAVLSLTQGVVQLQSDGTTWHQIN